MRRNSCPGEKRKRAKAAEPAGDAEKSSIAFMLALEEYLAEKKAGLIPAADIVDDDIGLLFPAQSIRAERGFDTVAVICRGTLTVRTGRGQNCCTSR